MATGNVPAGTADNLSVGNAVAYIGPEGATPDTDVGFLAAEGISLSFEAEVISADQGIPRTSVRQFITAVNVTWSFVTQEWNLPRFRDAMNGVYSTTTGGGGEEIRTLGVGVNACPLERTGQVIFCMPCSLHTIEIDLWRIQSDGNFEISFDPEGLHQFTYTFQLLQATQKWDATALTADVSLFEIRRTLPP